jgi:hypothetical protein
MKNFILSLFLSLTCVVFAQVPPQAFNYSAIARNANNAPLASTTLGIQISIKQTTATGTIVYQETHNPTTDEFGLFNLVIGSGAIITGSMQSIAWANDSYFLELAMDATGGANYQAMGTTQLISVPYALHAATAGSLVGSMPNQFNVPTITSNAASELTSTSATLNGNINNDVNANIVRLGFVISQQQNPNIFNTQENVALIDTGDFSKTINLAPNITYYYKAYALTLDNITKYGDQQTFTTPETDFNLIASVDNLLPCGSATFSAAVNNTNNYTITNRRFLLSTNADFTGAISISVNTSTDFTQNYSGLQQGTTYYLKAVCAINGADFEGEAISFELPAFVGNELTLNLAPPVFIGCGNFSLSIETINPNNQPITNHYKISQNEDFSEAITVDITPFNTTYGYYYQDLNLNRGTTYFIKAVGTSCGQIYESESQTLLHPGLGTLTVLEPKLSTYSISPTGQVLPGNYLGITSVYDGAAYNISQSSVGMGGNYRILVSSTPNFETYETYNGYHISNAVFIPHNNNETIYIKAIINVCFDNNDPNFVNYPNTDVYSEVFEYTPYLDATFTAIDETIETKCLVSFKTQNVQPINNQIGSSIDRHIIVSQTPDFNNFVVCEFYNKSPISGFGSWEDINRWAYFPKTGITGTYYAKQRVTHQGLVEESDVFTFEVNDNAIYTSDPVTVGYTFIGNNTYINFTSSYPNPTNQLVYSRYFKWSINSDFSNESVWSSNSTHPDDTWPFNPQSAFYYPYYTDNPSTGNTSIGGEHLELSNFVSGQTYYLKAGFKFCKHNDDVIESEVITFTAP